MQICIATVFFAAFICNTICLLYGFFQSINLNNSNLVLLPVHNELSLHSFLVSIRTTIFAMKWVPFDGSTSFASERSNFCVQQTCDVIKKIHVGTIFAMKSEQVFRTQSVHANTSFLSFCVILCVLWKSCIRIIFMGCKSTVD